MFRSIKIRLSAILIFITALVFTLAESGIICINNIAGTVSSVSAESLPLVRCSKEALMAVASGASYLDKALLIQDAAETDKIRRLEMAFSASIITFDMFVKAIVWGSESPQFRTSTGGLAFAEWERKGWSRNLVVMPAPKHVQQLAGEADIYYSGFAKYGKKILAGKKKIMRLTLLRKNDEAVRAEAELQENIKKTDHYRNLVEAAVKKISLDVYNYLYLTVGHIKKTSDRAKAALFSFAVAIFVLSLGLGAYFCNRAILRPIARMQKGMQIIGSGHWDYKIGMESESELGQLAAAFDNMVERLKSMTASRDELQREVVEREKAEKELKHAYAELAATQAQLVQSAKMASIGVLAGGVAHEINNPLSGILNNVQLIKLLAAEDKSFNMQEFRELLDLVEEASVRCVKITRSLLDFSHASKGSFQLVSFNDAVEKVDGLIGRELALSSISFQKELLPNLPYCLGDTQLLQQVIFDLVCNAKWAIEKGAGKKEGTIRIKTAFDPQKKDIVATISDTGIGIPKEHLERIFEPFFTTKPIGEGTGLGLSVVYNIIKDHKGSIEVESKPNHGTTFTIRLPAP